ncbi:BZ3500_MvSof-1268-A1-R1_Chr1-3g02100 [Microbotryum saponariae]|uniref:BZ3500_MvSof-1268-A1-R1_Chr1-3g02100 protein n=1 Tax=Microbotryum saponariae TaxID=289078 RepID=A0A2X0KNN1_9BASI|nr:BZ3500_MvSof-1268-A1-R1_Chr1-3g02100 [Microbotryum saponariae]SCZ95402.1 BZ3501_MvSof-1269-A2-R1_Chr1-3g01702 [Microbotryum saponariae]
MGPPNKLSKDSSEATPATTQSANASPPIPARDPNDPMTWAERGLFPIGAAPPLNPESDALVPRVETTRESVDERCWIRTKQTNARRALGREPRVTMYCYLNFKKQIVGLIPVPGQRGAYMAKDAPVSKNSGPTHYVPTGPPTTLAPPPTVPFYHWPRLEDRYIYIARGRTYVNRHLQESGGPAESRISIEDLAERCEQGQMARAAERKQRAVQRALGMVDPIEFDEYEKLISLSEVWSHSLQRLHLHVHRIYSPGWRNLARVPEVWTDGTASKMLERCKETLSDGSAFNLVGRMYESTIRVLGELEERRRKKKEGGSDPGIGGGSGGIIPPPLPPSVGGPPPM